MSATPSGWIRSLLANAVVRIGIGAVVAGGPLGPWPARALDVSEPQPPARTAAIKGVLEGPRYRAGPTAHRTEVQANLQRLPQNGPPTQVEAPAPDDTILVALALSEPYTVAEHIAEQHRLELLDQTELSSLGLRVVRYRVPDDRPIAPIIANLQKDQRIGSVQANVEYGLPIRGFTMGGRPSVDQQTSRYDSQGTLLRRTLRPNTALVGRSADGPRAAAQPGTSGAAAAAKPPDKRPLAYERRRRHLLDQLAVVETARRMVLEQLEELERSQANGLKVSGGISAETLVNRQAARDEARETDSFRRANLRRRCSEIKVDPEGYEQALVHFCGKL